MYKQYYYKLSSKLSSKATLLGKHLSKEKIIPPQNLTRYLAAGFISYHIYTRLDNLTKLYPINKVTKVRDVININNRNILDEEVTLTGFSTDRKRILNNLLYASSVGLITWYAPYIMLSLFTTCNYIEYVNDLEYFSKYLKKENKNTTSSTSVVSIVEEK